MIGEFVAMMKACAADPTPAGVRDGAIIALVTLSGLRREEIVSLDMEDFQRAEVVVIDTGGYERPAGEFYIIDWTQLQRLLPPGVTKRLWTVTAIPVVDDDPEWDPSIHHIYVPIEIENTGGYDLVGYEFDLSDYVSVIGFASNGLQANTFDDPSIDFRIIPPGESISGDVIFGTVYSPYYPSIDPDTLKVQWVWLMIELLDEVYHGPFQIILRKS
jgi:hypothetical protein